MPAHQLLREITAILPLTLPSNAVYGVLKVVIGDRDPDVRTALQEWLNRLASFQVIAETSEAQSTIAAVRKHTPDIVVLDVEFFEVIESIHHERQPALIFIATTDKDAMRAFEAGAVDYIVKPLNQTRFEKALERARLRASSEPGNVVQQIKALMNGNHKSSPERMALKSGGRIILVEVDKIRWIESDGNYLRIHLDNGALIVRGTLTAFEARLNGDQFVRIHRSIIVNKQHIKEIKPWYTGEYAVFLDDGKELTLSRTYRDRFQRLTAPQNGQ